MEAYFVAYQNQRLFSGNPYTSNRDWAGAHDATDAPPVSADGIVQSQCLASPSSYVIQRCCLEFNTNGLSGVSAATLYLACGGWQDDGTDNSDLYIVEGAFSDPVVDTDFYALKDMGISGSEYAIVSHVSVTVGYTQLEIPLNGAGVSAINPSGFTKFALRLKGDVEDTAPVNTSDNNEFDYQTGTYGAPWGLIAPSQLPATDIYRDSAYLHLDTWLGPAMSFLKVEHSGSPPTYPRLRCRVSGGHWTSYATGLQIGDSYDFNIAGLTPNTYYTSYIRMELNPIDYIESNGIGFTTNDTPTPTLTISTLPAIEITRSSALLNGEVSGSTPDEVYFEWGTDTGYGDTTSSQSAEPDITFSRRLSGLDALTEYHFRAVAVLSGTYYYGEDATFTTTNIFVLDPTIVENTYEVNTVLGQTISTLRGTVHDKLANMDIQEGMDIVSYDISNGEKIFAGITSIVTDYTTGIERYFDLLCQDYSVLLDRTLVYATYPAGFTYVYDSTTFYGDQAIIMDLFQNRCLFPSGAANGQLGPSEITVVDYVAEGTHGLTAMNFLNMTLRECLDLLAGYVNFAYYVDYDKKLHYFYKPNVPAVYGLSSSPNGTTTLGYHGLKRKRDATRIVNTFLVLGSQLHGADNFWIHAGNGVGWIFVVNPKLTNGTSVIPIGAPSTTTTGLIQVFINTGSDMAPSWVEDTNGGIYGVDEVLTPSLIPVSHDWLFDPSTNLIYFQTPPPSFATNSFRIGYCLLLNGGLPDTIPGSITKYGRAFTTRLVAQDANTAATILNNLAHLEEQFSYALEILTLSLDSVDFPGNTRFERGQLTHLDNTVLGIDKDYWIHAITVKVAGGTIVSYDLELRSYTLE